ncbi:phage head morphogenesis protein [Limnobaculum zhutongyuii]|nr:phage minor head protein [Limnobaculum zhutongyuii]
MPTANGVDLSYAIGVPPAKAIEYFESKGYAVGFNWHDVEASAHASAFTVAGILKQDILEDIRNSLNEHLKNGGTYSDFQKQIIPILEKKGWLGSGLVADSDGVLQGKRVQPRRLETIYRTNMQAAYNAGRYQEQLSNKDSRPYLERVAIADSRTRPAHLSLNGFIAHIDDPVWAILYPPDGYRCRCRARSGRDVERLGLTVQSSEGLLVEVSQPWENGETRTVTAFKNPHDGKLYTPDAGFGHNPGQGYLSSLGQRLLDRATVADVRLASTAVNEILKNPALLNAVSKDVKTFIDNTLINKQAKGMQRHVGALPASTLDRLSEKGLHPESAVITLTDNHLLEAQSGSASLPATFWQQLPAHMHKPSAILFDTQQETPELLYVFDIDDARGKHILSVATRFKERSTPQVKSNSRANPITHAETLPDAGTLRGYEILFGEVK